VDSPLIKENALTGPQQRALVRKQNKVLKQEKSLESECQAKVVKFVPRRAFGVELELGNKLSLQQLKVLVESVCGGHQVYVTNAYGQDYNNNYWHLKLDRSCGDVEGGYGCEIASFKATEGIKDVLTMFNMVQKVQEGGANINERCGIHVHVEVKDYSWKQMATMMANWIKMEPMISHMIPQNRADNKYCKFYRHASWVRRYMTPQPDFSHETLWSLVRPYDFTTTDRRKSINLCNFCAESGRKTIEFRFPEASLDALDMKNWIRLFVHLLEHGRKNEFPADLSMFDFIGFLTNCGLHGTNPFAVLSPGLRETKLWLLRRVCKHSRSEEFREKAKSYLEFMTLRRRTEEQALSVD
jgi:hypothetical protein